MNENEESRAKGESGNATPPQSETPGQAEGQTPPSGLRTSGGRDFRLNIAGLDAAQKGDQAPAPSDGPPVPAPAQEPEEKSAEASAEAEASPAADQPGPPAGQEEAKTPQDAAPGAEKPKMHGCLRTLIHTSLILSASLILAMLLLWTLNEMFALAKPARDIDVKITAPASISGVSGQLKKQGVIQSSFLFSVYTSLTHSGSVKAGTYTLSTDMSYMQIVRDLRRGAPREVVRVTIPEGYTLQKIGDLLESKAVCSKQDFLSVCDSADTKFAFSAQVPAAAGRFYRLEGYLFPDTYDFYKNQSAQAAADKMLGNFDDRFTQQMQQRAKQLNMTVDQVVTLASIIQVESSDVKEMANVSSVFHNRLDKGVDGHHFLQSDATIFYIKRNINTVLSSSDTSIDSPYNTYKHELLPPGPICNPGLDAINAALNPANSNYYFFVTDKNNKYYYSETYSEHVSAVAKAMKSGNATGTDVVK